MTAAGSFDPRPLRAYFEALGMDYFFEEQPIIDLARSACCSTAAQQAAGRSQQEPPSSICSFCARMKRGRLYAAMRREGCAAPRRAWLDWRGCSYNVLALGQHLDDAAESFVSQQQC